MRARTHALLPVLVAATLMGGLIVAPEAGASHYRFDRIEIVSGAERQALGAVGIHDTRALLRATAQLSDRVWLSRRTQIALPRVTALATQCDLLRVEGLGPSMMGVLQDAGVQDTRALGRALAAPLLERMKAATAGTTLRYRLPNEAILDGWIRQARSLRVLLSDVPELPTTEPIQSR